MTDDKDNTGPTPAGGWLTVTDMCALFNRSRNTIRNWAELRGLPYCQPGGRHCPWLFHADDVRAWLAEQYATGTLAVAGEAGEAAEDAA